MGDVAKLDLLANASCNGNNAALAFTGTGFSSMVTGGVGIVVATLDPGLPGDNVTVAQSRVVATVTGGAGNANIQVAKSVVAGQLTLTITTFVAAAATNEAFDIEVYRDPSN